MVNIFPELLTYGLIAPFILRLALGWQFVNSGYKKIKENTNRSAGGQLKNWLEITIGGLLIVGFATQIAALLASMFILVSLINKQNDNQRPSNDLIRLAIAISLLFSGAGLPAIDLPL